jgi:tRNA-specific 2-thiouridylase
VLGEHRGILHYTVGQRRGLGLASGERLYVLEVDAAHNAVVVGPRAALAAGGLVTGAFNWLVAAPPPAGTRAEVRIRAHHAPAPATLTPLPDGRLEVAFDEPQSAVTPGQLAVCYAGDRVLGGAPIERARSAA